mmetsp:Transcript_5964/g.19284  ORF Transcript_5964/g.19284 Transcript_5964/m.19284 type:complete len:218 (-) Transcript_5964:443-1096(-)
MISSRNWSMKKRELGTYRPPEGQSVAVACGVQRNCPTLWSPSRTSRPETLTKLDPITVAREPPTFEPDWGTTPVTVTSPVYQYRRRVAVLSGWSNCWAFQLSATRVSPRSGRAGSADQRIGVVVMRETVLGVMHMTTAAAEPEIVPGDCMLYWSTASRARSAESEGAKRQVGFVSPAGTLASDTYTSVFPELDPACGDMPRTAGSVYVRKLVAVLYC